ncbi:unnamed protein product [Prunus armeniaca]|uniref:Uncharacterized protein n=1 Tax=Prunus armeniaca TaxID=36596 RepID=A0A6J5XK37_PRUAR|nr:unnamed protein product [Prunus armeniaca]CAB4312342.1 unnamed protein product [Prunus armeniaca]
MQQMLKGVCCKVWCIWFEKRDPIYHQNFKAVAMNASVEFRGLVWMVLYILEVAAFTEEILFVGESS